MKQFVTLSAATFLFFVVLDSGAGCARGKPSAGGSSDEVEIAPHLIPGLGKMYLPDRDDSIQNTLRSGRIWEEDAHEIFEEFIEPGETVVDAGAYIGSHTLKLARLAYPGKVFAFEPQRDIYELLLKNIEVNELEETVEAYPVALGDRSCTTKMMARSTRNLGATPVLGCIDDPDGPEVFEMRTLDSFGLKDVAFIKIDVEGSHGILLEGAKETIQRSKPVMLIEIGTGGRGLVFTHHELPMREDVIATLEGMGYRVRRWRGADFLALPKE